MAGDAEQAAKDAAIAKALQAYDQRDRAAPYEELFRLWEALWEVCDFSWDGLADAGWERGHHANFAQKLKRWPAGGERATLQDYWRRTPTPSLQRDQFSCPSDHVLSTFGLLRQEGGVTWHAAHWPGTKVGDAEHDALSQAIMWRLRWWDAQDQDDWSLMLMGARARGIDRVLRHSSGETRQVHVLAPLAELASWDVDKLRFGDGAWFGDATFGNGARFGRATFGDGAWFGDATFGDGAWFYGATFGNGAGFNGATFGNRAGFYDATFGDGAGFNGATFGDGAKFYGATFGKGVRFGNASFNGVTFENTIFEGNLDADDARFTGATSFRAAEIKGHAGFAGCIWPEAPGDAAKAFEGCRFRDVADFKTADLGAFALFDGAEFKGRVLLEDPGGDPEDALFAKTLEATAAVDDADAQLGALMGGVRTLKQAMGAQGDRDREQRFFRYEVQARAKRPGEGRVAKAAAWLYGKTSGYGGSIGRPLVAVGTLGLLFAALYFAASFNTTPAAPFSLAERAVGAADFSLTNAFRPFAALATPAKDDGSVGAALLLEGPRTALLVRIAGVVQSLATIILLFLAGVALRRKFQIG